MCTSSFYSRWRKYIRPLLCFIYFLGLVIAVPWLIVNSVKDGFKKKDQLVLIGGLFVVSAIPISFWHIAQHIRKLSILCFPMYGFINYMIHINFFLVFMILRRTFHETHCSEAYYQNTVDGSNLCPKRRKYLTFFYKNHLI